MQHVTGLPLTLTLTHRSLETFFCLQVHASGMKVALKNCVEIVEDLVDCFDFAVNESCNKYDECDVSCKLPRSALFLFGNWGSARSVAAKRTDFFTCSVCCTRKAFHALALCAISARVLIFGDATVRGVRWETYYCALFLFPSVSYSRALDVVFCYRLRVGLKKGLRCLATQSCSLIEAPRQKLTLITPPIVDVVQQHKL